MYKLNQCILEKTKEQSVITRTTYIPSKFAKINKMLKLKKENGTWDNGWKVIFVGQEMDSDEIVTTQNAHKKHRKNSDI